MMSFAWECLALLIQGAICFLLGRWYERRGRWRRRQTTQPVIAREAKAGSVHLPLRPLTFIGLDRFQAGCSCGWESPLCATPDEALDCEELHVRMAGGAERAAPSYVSAETAQERG